MTESSLVRFIAQTRRNIRLRISLIPDQSAFIPTTIAHDKNGLCISVDLIFFTGWYCNHSWLYSRKVVKPPQWSHHSWCPRIFKNGSPNFSCSNTCSTTFLSSVATFATSCRSGIQDCVDIGWRSFVVVPREVAALNFNLPKFCIDAMTAKYSCCSTVSWYQWFVQRMSFTIELRSVPEDI